MIRIRHTSDTRSVYDHIYTGEAIHQMDSFFLWILALLRLNQGQRLLDVSTGRGQMVKLAQSQSIDAYGLDFSQMACTLAVKKSPGHIVCGNGQELPFANETFDAVTNLGSLEHFEDMDQGVREMARVLKPAGQACLTVPNTFGLLWNVAVAWKTGDVDDDGQPLQRYGTRRQWERILETNGVLVMQVLGYEHEHAFPRTWHDLRRYWFHPIRIMRMLVWPRLPVNIAGQFVFLCRKSD